MTQEENHPFSKYITPKSNAKGGYIPNNTEVLILGTFPPKKEYEIKGDGFFYYSSERNHLWNRFDNIFKEIKEYEPLKKTNTKNLKESFNQNKQRKMGFCKLNNIGFIDIFSKISRKKEGSTDDPSLIPIENILKNGTFDNLIKSQSIKRICCVYTLAYEVLITNLPKYGYKIKTIPNEFTANKFKHVVEGFGKEFEVILLYPATRSPHKNEIKDFQYKKFLCKETANG